MFCWRFFRCFVLFSFDWNPIAQEKRKLNCFPSIWFIFHGNDKRAGRFIVKSFVVDRPKLFAIFTRKSLFDEIAVDLQIKIGESSKLRRKLVRLSTNVFLSRTKTFLNASTGRKFDSTIVEQRTIPTLSSSADRISTVEHYSRNFSQTQQRTENRQRQFAKRTDRFAVARKQNRNDQSQTTDRRDGFRRRWIDFIESNRSTKTRQTLDSRPSILFCRILTQRIDAKTRNLFFSTSKTNSNDV